MSDHSRLFAMAPPPGWTPAEWDLLLADARRFDQEGWCHVAAEHGWRPLDLWGIARWGPTQRLDLLGLVPALRGDWVIDLRKRRALVRTKSGSENYWRRRVKLTEPRVLVWDFWRG